LREHLSRRLHRFDDAADLRIVTAVLREHIFSSAMERTRRLVLMLGVGIFAIVPGYARVAASGENIFSRRIRSKSTIVAYPTLPKGWRPKLTRKIGGSA
jgi:hypothetical protein